MQTRTKPLMSHDDIIRSNKLYISIVMMVSGYESCVQRCWLFQSGCATHIYIYAYIPFCTCMHACVYARMYEYVCTCKFERVRVHWCNSLMHACVCIACMCVCMLCLRQPVRLCEPVESNRLTQAEHTHTHTCMQCTINALQ